MSLYFDSNLALLSRRQPELASLLAGLTPDRVQVRPARNNMPTALYRRADGTHVSLHDSRDPVAEARANLMTQELEGADYLVLLGFGLGYPLDAILECLPGEGRRFFIVESDLQILGAAFAARDLRHLLELPHIYFAWPVSGPALAEQWRAFFDPVLAQKNVYTTHAPSLVLAPEIFTAAAQVIQSQILQIFTDINTLIGKMDVFLHNFVCNWQDVVRSPGIESFRGRGAGIPCILVSAGPSLDRNIRELSCVGDRALILGVDTAVKPLQAAAVRPHFVLTADPTHQNYLHLQGADLSRSLVVAEATAHPGVFEEFRGRTVACTFADSALGPLAGLLTGKGTLRAWGSVATMGLDFALHLGCNPVILVGQDLAYSDGRPYCSGVHFERDWYAGLGQPEEWRARLARTLPGKNLLTLRDIRGLPVRTTDKLASYWTWLRKQMDANPGTAFINATEGGILREGVQVMSLREAVHRHCRRQSDLGSAMESVFRGAAACPAAGTAPSLDAIRRECGAIAGILEGGLRLCRHPNAESGVMMGRLDTIRESIYEQRRIAPLLDCFNQPGNAAFLRRRQALGARAADRPDPDAIQSLYADYFLSVREALAKIQPALDRLARATAKS